MRVYKLFYSLVLLVVVLLSVELRHELNKLKPKPLVVDHHQMYVTYPLLQFIDNKDQLAMIIGHEFGHLILGHTIGERHDLADEYHADIVGVYLAHKAGYSLCGMDRLWRKFGEAGFNLYQNSHPNPFVRSYYMEMPECLGREIKQESVSMLDAYEVFLNISKHVEGRYRHNTKFGIYFLTLNPNAFVFTKMKETH